MIKKIEVLKQNKTKQITIGEHMKYVLMAIIASAFMGCASTNITANLSDRIIRTGEVSDKVSSHDMRHQHKLVFKEKSTGKIFNVVESPELAKLHHETGKNYLIEADTVQTKKFLFWGGNLVVKNFKVIEETSDEIPHNEIKERLRKPSIMPIRRIHKDRS